MSQPLLVNGFNPLRLNDIPEKIDYPAGHRCHANMGLHGKNIHVGNQGAESQTLVAKGALGLELLATGNGQTKVIATKDPLSPIQIENFQIELKSKDGSTQEYTIKMTQDQRIDSSQDLEEIIPVETVSFENIINIPPGDYSIKITDMNAIDVRELTGLKEEPDTLKFPTNPLRQERVTSLHKKLKKKIA